jgi:hypothetical protein
VIGRDLEAMILRLHPDVSVRRIARELRVSRRTVHRVLGRLSVPSAPRRSFLDAEGQPSAVRFDNGPATRSPRVPT